MNDCFFNIDNIGMDFFLLKKILMSLCTHIFGSYLLKKQQMFPLVSNENLTVLIS